MVQCLLLFVKSVSLMQRSIQLDLYHHKTFDITVKSSYFHQFPSDVTCYFNCNFAVLTEIGSEQNLCKIFDMASSKPQAPFNNHRILESLSYGKIYKLYEPLSMTYS